MDTIQFYKTIISKLEEDIDILKEEKENIAKATEEEIEDLREELRELELANEAGEY